MSRIDPSRQDSMSASNFRFYHNQNWAKIEFYMKFGRKSTKFHVFQINLIIRFVGYVVHAHEPLDSIVLGGAYSLGNMCARHLESSPCSCSIPALLAAKT